MLEIYLGALAIGGTLLAATLVFGGHGDHGGDAAHASAGHGHGSDHAGGEGTLDWLPLTSLRFWTFFLAFFGGTGAALTLLEAPIGAIANAVIAAAVGWITGAATVLVLRRLKLAQVDSSVQYKHLVGGSARVLVEISAGRTGKVRIASGTSVEDLLADTEDDGVLPIGSQVLVYAGGDDGRVMVTRSAELEKRED